MCGGARFKIKNIPEQELKKYYSPELVKKFKTVGAAESFFWQKNAVLPVKGKNGEQLMLWGNKDKALKLPKTGWAKLESLKAGKWDYLHPKIADLPLDKGYEKKVWFDLPKGAKGIVVEKNKQERVYLLTQAADAEYKKETGHDREPLGEKKNFKKAE